MGLRHDPAVPVLGTVKRPSLRCEMPQRRPGEFYRPTIRRPAGPEAHLHKREYLTPSRNRAQKSIKMRLFAGCPAKALGGRGDWGGRLGAGPPAAIPRGVKT